MPSFPSYFGAIACAALVQGKPVESYAEVVACRLQERGGSASRGTPARVLCFVPQGKSRMRLSRERQMPQMQQMPQT